MTKTSKLCLVGKDIARLVGEDEKLMLYHCMSNDREKHACVLSGAEVEVIYHLCRKAWGTSLNHYDDYTL